jgi:peptide/nickel transport system substrate-binding protein
MRAPGMCRTRGARGPRRALSAVLACCLALTVAGCGDGGSSPEASPDDGEPQAGGTLRVSLVTGTNSLDPTRMYYGQASQGSGTVGYALYGGLMIVDRTTESVEPHMAESLETTDDGRTWELKLRPDLEFSDGTTFDAEAVKFNWDRVAAPESPSTSKSVIDTWTSYEVTDPLTLTVQIPEPNLQFPRVIASGSFNVIGSPTAIQADPEGFGLAPVGAGPFVLREFTPGAAVSLTKNPGYFDAPRPYLDELIVRFVVDDNQRIESFLANQDDLTYLLSDASVSQVTEQGKQVTLAPSTQASPLTINTALAPVDDLRVRQAFWQAADVAALCAARQGATCENPPRGLFGQESPYYTSEGDFPEHDLEAAQELIDEYRADTGVDVVGVSYTYVGDSDVATNVATVLQSNLQRLEGVEVTLDPVDATVIGARRSQGHYQMASGSFAGSSPDEQVYEYLHSDGLYQRAIGFADPEMDTALESTRTSAEPEAIAEAYAHVAQISAENILFLPYFDPVYAFGHDERVRDVQVFSDIGLRSDRVWMAQ